MSQLLAELVRTKLQMEEQQKVQFSREEVSGHCTLQDCWLIIDEQVYDVTPYLALHDGGADVILEYAGRDASTPFHVKGLKGHSEAAKSKLAHYRKGTLRQRSPGQH